MTQRWMIPLLVLAFIAFYLLPLGTHGLWIPDEARYAQIGQQILVDGNWVTPHFMDIRYFEKPIAGYWMIAIGQAIFGENLFGVRIASAIATGLSVMLAYLAARLEHGQGRRDDGAAHAKTEHVQLVLAGNFLR